ncbi:VOC family protein [Streptomyces sp. NPDC059853]|uniref:VOC family protein n=1 Tax=Streptomyces sp. NPDC059853 TaxID=3346973 RepID=UPI0036482AA6
MADFPDGAPIWADCVVAELNAGKTFYREMFGWDFRSAGPDYGGYTMATLDGKPVSALMPPMPGQELTPTWTLYFATSDVQETAGRIRENGGTLLLEPMSVGEFGRMLIAQSPDGLTFGCWQPGTHEGFGLRGEPGSVCWSEIVSRDPAAFDTFFSAVFPVELRRMGDPAEFDYKTVQAGGSAVAGRMPMPADTTAATDTYARLYFGVDHCDDAAATAEKLGGRIISEPQDSPFGRWAECADDNGARFTVIDMSTTKGEKPAM